MPNEYVMMLFFLMWHFLVILAILFSVSGLDDLFIDIYFWIRYLCRAFKKRRYEPLTYEKLAAVEEQYIAVLLPCWHEANVIGAMLRHNAYSIDYKKYYIFVGVYPNDPDTIAEVEHAARHLSQVRCVIGSKPGPTSKAANLSELYWHIKQFEKTLEKPFSIYVCHDSEDIIHPLSFKLYNYLMPRKDMIQIPVFPLEVGYFKFTHWLYADEFSENHTKDIVVREAIQAHVPSAGVGTAFSAHALKTLEHQESGTPFSMDSLTEDYRTSLALRMKQLKGIFVTQSIARVQWVKRGGWRPKYVQKIHKEYVATRAMFPVEYKKAVRQKARWIMGIVFQEWDHSAWPKDWRVRYSLAHDRKSFATHFINGFGYIVFVFWLLYGVLTANHPVYPSLQEQLNMHPWVWWLIVSVSAIMMERLVQRVIAVRRVYGWIPALLSIPRAFYGNILNLHASMRAYKLYFSAARQSSVAKTAAAKPAWDKTDHEFPGRHILTPFRRRLGDLLLEQNLVTVAQLNLALLEHHKTGERLGSILQRMNVLTQHQLMHILSQQYQLRLFPQKDVALAVAQCRKQLPRKVVSWLTRRHISAVEYDAKANVVTVAVSDPTNELLLRNIIRYFADKQVEFVLITNDEGVA